MKSVDTLIIGGGQAGLSTSYFLKQAGKEHIILEKAETAGSVWRNGRWDSFCLNTPNWTIRLPGLDIQALDPDAFMPRAEIVSLFENYAANLPIQYSSPVLSINNENGSFRVITHQETWQARNVVIATGLYQKPKVPAFATAVHSQVLQLTSETYRNEVSLPPGAVLVVGSAQSGCQIAEDLYQGGRKVYLCVGSAGRAPRRYRGKDIFEWLVRSGFMNSTTAQLPSPLARFAGNPQISGTHGGHNLNLHQFHRDGVLLLGRLREIRDGYLFLAPDLKENLAKADQFEADLVKKVDNYITQNDLQAPEEHLPDLKDAYLAPNTLRLNLAEAGITTIIWALGYDFNFSIVRLPVFDEAGFPITSRCAASIPGLYFVGLPWLVDRKSGLLLGVADDARLVAEQCSS
jgi:putative flavoprotein involved in K+ transport